MPLKSIDHLIWLLELAHSCAGFISPFGKSHQDINSRLYHSSVLFFLIISAVPLSFFSLFSSNNLNPSVNLLFLPLQFPAFKVSSIPGYSALYCFILVLPLMLPVLNPLIVTERSPFLCLWPIKYSSYTIVSTQIYGGIWWTKLLSSAVL